MGSSETVYAHGHGFEGAGLQDSLQGVEACVATYQEVQLDRDEYMNLVAMESEAGMAIAGKCHSKAAGEDPGVVREPPEQRDQRPAGPAEGNGAKSTPCPRAFFIG